MDEEHVAPINLHGLAEECFCYLTTTGRLTGRPHIIKVWFELDGHTLYMLSGGRASSDWVKNISRSPEVAVRIGDYSFRGLGRVVEDPKEDALARKLLLDKYQRSSDDLTRWGADRFTSGRRSRPLSFSIKPKKYFSSHSLSQPTT